MAGSSQLGKLLLLECLKHLLQSIFFRLSVFLPTVQVASGLEVAGSSRLGKVVDLQLEALWQRHGFKLYVAAGAATAYVLWRLLFRTASIFVNITESLAEYGFMVGAAAAPQDSAATDLSNCFDTLCAAST